MNFDKDSNYDSRVRFHHFEISGTDGGMGTIAYVMDKNRNQNVRSVRFACSFCAPEDQFSKKKGRVKSYGKLLSEKGHFTMNISIPHQEKGYFTIVNDSLREFALSKSPTFNVLRKAFYALASLVTVRVSDLPDVCMFLDSNGHVFEKKGNQIIDLDGNSPAPDPDDLVISTNEDWLNDAKTLVK